MAEKREKNENTSVVDLQSITASDVKLTKAGYQEENGNDVYDPFSNREIKYVTSDFGALMHLFKGSLGSGILAVPRAFKNSGLILGIIGTIIIGTLSAHCVAILVKCSHILLIRDKKPSLSFPETAEVAFRTGPKGLRKYSNLAKLFVTLSLLSTYYLANTVIIVLISQAFKEIFNNYFEIDLAIRWYILMVAIPVLPLGIGRILKYMVPLSVSGALFIILGILVTLTYTVKDLPPIEKKHLIVPSLSNIPSFAATILFALEGIGNIMPIENSMRNPRHFRGCCGVLSISMCSVLVMYGVIGSICYLKYGEATRANITLNLPHDILSDLVKLFVALSLISTYSLQMCAPSEIVWNKLKPMVSAKNEDLSYYLMRGSMIIGTIIIALIIPNLAPFISLVGSVCLSILGLGIPAMIEMATFWEEDTGYWRILKNIFIIICSIAAVFIGGYTSIEEIIQFYRTPQ